MGDTYRSPVDDALGTDDAVELRRRLTTGEVTASELAEAARRRAGQAQHTLNAVISWAPANDSGTPLADRPFSGIPTVIKDNEEVLGLPTRQGSRATSQTPATGDSDLTALFRSLGFAVVAKTTMPEFGLTATTEPLLSGPTRNPWNTDHSVGGSSGGSAALVASGVLPLAHANDGGGSIRIPAACCGLVGFKPSRGLMPTPERMKALPVKIAAQGVLTRSVRDTAAFFAHIRPEDPLLEPVGVVDRPAAPGLRIGVFTRGVGDDVDPEVRQGVLKAAEVCEDLGHHVELVEPPVTTDFGRDFLRYWAFLAWAIRTGGRRAMGPEFSADALEPFTMGLADFFTSIALGVPASVRRLRRFGAQYDAWFGDFDLLLSPVTGSPAPEVGYLSPQEDFRTHALRLLPFAGFTAPQNVAGAPAISLPTGISSQGLPLAVHVAGRPGDDRRILELAVAFEEAAPWQTLPSPSLSAER